MATTTTASFWFQVQSRIIFRVVASSETESKPGDGGTNFAEEKKKKRGMRNIDWKNRHFVRKIILQFCPKLLTLRFGRENLRELLQ